MTEILLLLSFTGLFLILSFFRSSKDQTSYWLSFWLAVKIWFVICATGFVIDLSINIYCHRWSNFDWISTAFYFNWRDFNWLLFDMQLFSAKLFVMVYIIRTLLTGKTDFRAEIIFFLATFGMYLIEKIFLVLPYIPI